MKADAVRDIALAHAIETSPPHEALPSAARCEAITQEVLHTLGKPALGGRAGQAAFAQFLQLRAKRIIQASQLPADVRQLWQHAPGLARWAPLAIGLLALCFGFASHRITDPHRVDLLSLSLMGIVLWNLLMYAVLLLRSLLRLARRQPARVAPWEPAQLAASGAAPSATVSDEHPGWLARLRGKAMPALRGSGLRKMALRFERNWWLASEGVRNAQWLQWLHLGAALVAVGALASLWLTGLTKEYQVGWESTFLSATQVQHWLNILFAPTQWLQWTTPWSLADIQALQGWVSSSLPAARAAGAAGAEAIVVPASSVGERWVWAYTALLGATVVLPRLLLAAWQGLRARWRRQHLQLPLNQAYFARLQRDFGGLATRLVLLPFSMDVTPERRAAIDHHAIGLYGAGAHVDWLPTLAYGAPLPAVDIAPAAQAIALINLSATPEAEVHGELLTQLRNRYGANGQLWLWASDFAARNTGAPRRLQEREALWQEFAQQHGFNAQLITTGT
ncbi:hypothetical protein M2375_002460 [Comamonas sp. BIGb0152]|uniref:DUF2868 domain-containing protein n=1 Tax=Comamonas sp. BIGb0152 TaxID=2940601 RepID=UPI002166C9CE|nr:DUF2868 domain-containing protein [Comamonas sp. BIGb0152]MCS4294227.1 hypothetical protein [Comamonas sp. BIGb0152]